MLRVLITNSFSGEGNLSIMKSKRPKTDSSGIMVPAVISWVRVHLLQPIFTLQIENFCCCHYTILHIHNIFQLYWYRSNYSYNETCLNCCLNYLICNSQHCAAADHNTSVSLVHQFLSRTQHLSLLSLNSAIHIIFFWSWNLFTANEAKNFNTLSPIDLNVHR